MTKADLIRQIEPPALRFDASNEPCDNTPVPATIEEYPPKAPQPKPPPPGMRPGIAQNTGCLVPPGFVAVEPPRAKSHMDPCYPAMAFHDD